MIVNDLEGVYVKNKRLVLWGDVFVLWLWVVFRLIYCLFGLCVLGLFFGFWVLDWSWGLDLLDLFVIFDVLFLI